MRRKVMAAAMGAAALAVGAGAQTSAPRSLPVDIAVDDARRAAAGRLLAASRFRERQAVLLDDSISAARAALLSECLDLAAEGRDLAHCRATAAPDRATAARLAARRSAMLDEIMAASQTIYARRFTAAEMDEITRFFRTPVGRKYGDLYPQVITEVQTRKAAIARRYLVEAAAGRTGSRRP